MLSRLDLRGPDADPRVALAAATSTAAEPVEAVREIIDAVRAGGDAALRELTARFDGCTIDDLRVPAAEIRGRARTRPMPELRAALERAAERIRGYHEAQGAAQGPVEFDADGIAVEELLRPVDRAGLYVPGGRAAYPSTVLMTAIPAVRRRGAGDRARRAAGLGRPRPRGDARRRSRCPASPRSTGSAARRRSPRSRTAPSRSPRWTSSSARATCSSASPSARSPVQGSSGIESPAGPSELVVVADQHGPPNLVASDLAAQAEHGPGGTAILVTWVDSVADAVDTALAAMVADASRRDEMEMTLADGGRVVLVRDAAQAMEVVNLLAPEHLEIVTEDPDALLPLVRNAGAVFLGPYAPTALGDYAAGANHVLPTGRSARFASALRVDDFRKHVHVVRATPEGSARAQSLGRSDRTGRGTRRARALPGSAGEPVSDKPRLMPRDDLRALEGYHSPQLDVSVRLNTNESPFPPPPGFVDAWLAALAAAPLHRYPDRAARELRSAIGEAIGQSPVRVFCANGSNEVLQTLMLTYGGSGTEGARLRADLRAAQSHRAPHRHRGRRRVPPRRLRCRSGCRARS